jgi:putative ABC transport system substrate-binding protein
VLELALRHRIPNISPNAAWAEAGSLMSYAPDVADVCRRAVVYVQKILNGAKPADMPVEQPTKFELTINLRTARALGIQVPPLVFARDPMIIE